MNSIAQLITFVGNGQLNTNSWTIYVW